MISNLTLEQEVLGSLMQPGADPEIVSELTQEMFTTRDTISVFQTIKTLAEAGDEFNMAAVFSWQNVQYGDGDVRMVSPQTLALWSTQMGNIFRLRVLVNSLRNVHERDSLERLLEKMLHQVRQSESVAADVKEELLAELNTMDLGNEDDITDMNHCLDTLDQIIADNQNDRTRHTGYPTGLPQMDEQSPMPETGLAVIAGASSHGKSAMASSILLASALQGLSVGYISLEMGAVSLTARALAQHGGRDGLEHPVFDTGAVSADTMRRCRLDVGDQSWVRLYRDELRRKGVAERYFMVQRRDESLTAIKRQIRKLAVKKGARIVVVDYLQLIQTDGSQRNETQEHFTARCSRDLKNLGDKLGILIIALSQLNRDLLSVRPTLNRLRDSGQIAEAADWVLLLWRPEAVAPNVTFDGDWKPLPTKGLGMVIVAKNREGRTYEDVVRWIGRSTLYYEDAAYMKDLWAKVNFTQPALPQAPVQTTLDFKTLR